MSLSGLCILLLIHGAVFSGAPLERPVTGVGLGEIIDSKNPAFPTGSVVIGLGFSWEEYSKVSAANLKTFSVIPIPRNPKIALTNYLNVLGLNGLTAFAAIETLVKFKKDQVVYISSAAGPVGSFLAILAKREGVQVIGSAGSDEKVQYLLNNIGVDTAFNYKTLDAQAELKKHASDGLDIHFDLVAGESLDVTLEHMKPHAQVVAVGNVGESNAKVPYVNKNLGLIIKRSLTVNGLSAFHHLDKYPLLWEKIMPFIERGEIPAQRETVIKGSEYLDGKYHDKISVEVATL
ncbi:hypothetical protein EMPS_01858 [Entomortierella parvispora]|uniref:Alcohol dehydrogenase-like C-terminal domain-containing protein n=1 Tax=Entomortierella parvispora TaxID=205924 RepID=A0A9P3H4C7_9FUNG|nr:hypothetical protein EMPS_01858 [Entomortierella parvispora]